MTAFNPGIPVHIYEGGMTLPTEGDYYLVAGNGMWLHKDTGIVKGFVPLNGISVLEDLDADEYVECNLPKLPIEHVWKIKEFFRRVVKKYNSEASTTLYYNKSDQSFKIEVPKQNVTHGSVGYRRSGMTHMEDMKNYLRVGTIHSHCDFGAFHSGTDISDEKDFDGLHCTFGHNNKDEFTITASIVVNSKRKKVDPTSVLDGISLCPKIESADSMFSMFFQGSKEDSYNIEIIDEETKNEWSEEIDLWMEQVTGHDTSLFSFLKKDEIKVGDMVDWTSSLQFPGMRDSCGPGPYEVKLIQEDKISIKTKIGIATYSSKLFRKTI